MPTLLDVAARAGVSKSTASRALSHPQLVAAGTVERVLAAAVELGFVPNRAARELARGRTGVIALVVPTLTNTFFTPIIGGAQERAARDGLQVTVAVNELSGAEDLLRYQRLAQQVDGAVVVAPRCSDETLRTVVSARPAVLVDRELAGTASVVADTAAAFVQLLTALADAGHARVAFLGGPDRSWQSGQRTRALREAAGDRGLELTVLGPYPPTFDAGVAAVAEILAAEAGVVLPFASDLGLGALFGLQQHGRASWSARPEPDDAGIVVVGRPQAPMVDVDGIELGRRAVHHVIDQLRAPLARPGLVSLTDGDPGPDPGRSPVAERLPVPVSWPTA
ncbi:LacI family transcriptional regulator [Ruania suaedae]|uniref:LacI family DNA-binding transcriptional regulator n=1 Tax=Ruania suaedae TaxID=2897774 RepID=UPI001E4AA604|nr:LacI family DNA-binding transcriptional regulator [Ruania suaedae]UFU03165.1 LacI family transcriptional regulator [Ruania suaedae]